MRNLTATICLTLAVLLGSAGMSLGADFHKGLDAYNRGDYATALREWKPLAEQGDAYAQVNLEILFEQNPELLNAQNEERFEQFENQVKAREEMLSWESLTCRDEDLNEYVFRTDGRTVYINDQLQKLDELGQVSLGIISEVEKQAGKLVFLVTQKLTDF
jgi:hypothetical protein